MYQDPYRQPYGEASTPGYGQPAVAEEAGPPGRDRLWVHLSWEAVLLIGVVVAAFLVHARSSQALHGSSLHNLALGTAVAILLASGLSLSLRAAAPNLAVGSIAGAAGVAVAWLMVRHGEGWGLAVGLTAAAALGAAIVLAVLVLALRAPGWAVSFGAVALISAGVLGTVGTGPLPVTVSFDIDRWAWVVLAAAAVLSVGGGALATIPSLRNALGHPRRHAGDPAAARGGPANLVTAAALIGSVLLAAAAGVVAALHLRAAIGTDTTDVTVTLAALGAALLGGTSLHGRRGGILGTALAAALLQLVELRLTLSGAPPWQRLLAIGIAVAVGLLVSRLVEVFGTPRVAVWPTQPPDLATTASYQPPHVDLWAPTTPPGPPMPATFESYGGPATATPGGFPGESAGTSGSAEHLPTQAIPVVPGSAPAAEPGAGEAPPGASQDLDGHRTGPAEDSHSVDRPGGRRPAEQ